ncbi:ankyrin repeat domain-containing protein [Gynuella sp.]|uniref:ankyrin repeat domain-containing protein n=1 Tax=Gynuella sp. TaxID=2969146 RepID=UPI003D10C0CB
MNIEIEFLKACERGDLEKAKALANGTLIDTSAFDNGWTPLMRACSFGCHPELVKYLISLGVLVDELEPEDGSTALFEAASEGQPEIIEILLENGANINHQDFEGYTAIMYAVISPEPKSIDCLLRNNANTELLTKDGQKFIDIARGFDNERILSVLSKFNL